MLLSAENKVAKKVGKASFTGCFRRNRVEWNAREGGEGKGKGKEGGNWMVARRRKERRDRIALDREGRTRQGVGVERNTRGMGEANDIHSHSSVGSGCCANEPQRRCEYRWYTVGNGERERERACYVAYVRACVRLFRARCYQRARVDLYPFYCRGILAFANTEQGHAAPGFSPHDGISLFPSQGILNGFPFPPKPPTPPLEKKKKSHETRHACLHAFFPALRA